MADVETNGWAMIQVRINLLKNLCLVPLATLACFTWPAPNGVMYTDTMGHHKNPVASLILANAYVHETGGGSTPTAK